MKSAKERYQEGDPITWLQVHNLFPIAIAMISAVAAFFIQQSRIDVLDNNLQNLKENIVSCNNRIMTAEEQVKHLGLDLKEIQTHQDVKGTSTVKVTPSPRPTARGGTNE